MNLVALGELVEIKGGGTPDKSVAEYWDGDIPWASVKDFKSGILDKTIDKISQQGVASSATQIIRAGSIIVPTRMAVGKVAINTIDLAINQDLKALMPKSGVDIRFLYHALLANGSKLEEQATGATVKGIKLDVLRNLEIPLPPLEKQKRIAAILDQADALRCLRRRALNRLNSLGQAIFHEMFGVSLGNSTLAKRQPLGEIIRVSSGSGLIAKDMRPAGIPVYGGNGVMGYHDEGPVPAETVVIGRVGAYCGAVHVTTEDCWVTDNALIVTKLVNIETPYLAAALKLADLNQYAGRAAQPLVSGSRIYPVEISVPPLDLQCRFGQVTEELQREIDIAEFNANKFNALFSSLQHRAFRGEL